jgi:hypothetical protein
MNRTTIANFIREISPMVPEYGPPCPEGLGIKWPSVITNKLISFEQRTATGPQIKQSLIAKIGGY